MDSFPAPKSPPDYAQLHGKHQQMVKVQALEREIAILEEEIKSLDGIPLASSCCKELEYFVEEHADPLVLEMQKSGTKSSWNRCLCHPFSENTQCCSCPRLDETECSSCLKSCTLKLFCPCCSCCLSKSFCRKMKCCRCCCCCCCCCRKSC